MYGAYWDEFDGCGAVRRLFFSPSIMYGESPFNRFESTKLGNDDNSALKLLVGRATWGNVIIMIGGGSACHRKFGNSKAL